MMAAARIAIASLHTQEARHTAWNTPFLPCKTWGTLRQNILIHNSTLRPIFFVHCLSPVCVLLLLPGHTALPTEFSYQDQLNCIFALNGYKQIHKMYFRPGYVVVVVGAMLTTMSTVIVLLRYVSSLLSLLEQVLMYALRYYCRYFLMGKVTASDHLMFVALVSKVFASHTIELTNPGVHMGKLRHQLLSRQRK